MVFVLLPSRAASCIANLDGSSIFLLHSDENLVNILKERKKADEYRVQIRRPLSLNLRPKAVDSRS